MSAYWSYDTVTFGIYVVAVIVLIISALVHVYSLLMAKLMRSFRKQKMGPPGPPGPDGATGPIGAPASIFTIRGVLSSIKDLPNPEHAHELDAYIIAGNVHVNIRLNPHTDDLPQLEWQNAGPILKFEGI